MSELHNTSENEFVSDDLFDLRELHTEIYAGEDSYNFNLDSRRQIENFLEEKALNKLLDDELYFDF